MQITFEVVCNLIFRLIVINEKLPFENDFWKFPLMADFRTMNST